MASQACSGASFADREDAGRQLAAAVAAMNLVEPVVVGLARGGIVVAGPISAELGVPLHAFVVRKISAPHTPELAVGAVAESVVADGEVIVVERAAADAVGASKKVIDLRVIEESAALHERVKHYRTDRDLPDFKGRTVVVVDDGIATGHTGRAACNAILQARPARLILAVPVCPRSSLRQFSDVEVLSLHRPESFRSVGQFYDHFEAVSDEQIQALLRSHNSL